MSEITLSPHEQQVLMTIREGWSTFEGTIPLNADKLVVFTPSLVEKRISYYLSNPRRVNKKYIPEYRLTEIGNLTKRKILGLESDPLPDMITLPKPSEELRAYLQQILDASGKPDLDVVIGEAVIHRMSDYITNFMTWSDEQTIKTVMTAGNLTEDAAKTFLNNLTDSGWRLVKHV